MSLWLKLFNFAMLLSVFLDNKSSWLLSCAQIQLKRQNIWISFDIFWRLFSLVPFHDFYYVHR